MKNTTVPVTAEWALWGKESTDREYRVLQCSDGEIGRDQFSEIITLYTLGTLNDLPQVAVMGLSINDRDYMAMTIHRQPEPARVDASGRKVTLTDCFFVPFSDNARNSVSYGAMYRKFRETSLPAGHSRAIKADLPVLRTPEPSRGRAMRAAELLLTNKPVCVLGADEVGIDQRLEFLDSVMTMLPYGMRGRLAAATLTKSNFYEHKFRLFFSSAPRPTDDWRMEWSERSSESRRPDEAKAYISWLTGDLKKSSSLLAGQVEPTGFSPSEVSLALKRLQVSSASANGAGQYTSVTPASASQPSAVRQRRPGTRNRGTRSPAMASARTSLVQDGGAGRQEAAGTGARFTKSRSSPAPAPATAPDYDPLHAKALPAIVVLLVIVCGVALGFILSSLH